MTGVALVGDSRLRQKSQGRSGSWFLACTSLGMAIARNVATGIWKAVEMSVEKRALGDHLAAQVTRKRGMPESRGLSAHWHWCNRHAGKVLWEHDGPNTIVNIGHKFSLNQIFFATATASPPGFLGLLAAQTGLDAGDTMAAISGLEFPSYDEATRIQLTPGAQLDVVAGTGTPNQITATALFNISTGVVNQTLTGGFVTTGSAKSNFTASNTNVLISFNVFSTSNAIVNGGDDLTVTVTFSST